MSAFGLAEIDAVALVHWLGTYGDLLDGFAVTRIPHADGPSTAFWNLHATRGAAQVTQTYRPPAGNHKARGPAPIRATLENLLHQLAEETARTNRG